MSEFKEYKHPNGYSARLYGESSLSIWFNGKEVLHTGSRNANTEDEVMELLESYPEFVKSLESYTDESVVDDEKGEDGKEESLQKSITRQIERVCEDICDNFCKYRESADENLGCDWIRKENKCPLDRLY